MLPFLSIKPRGDFAVLILLSARFLSILSLSLCVCTHLHAGVGFVYLDSVGILGQTGGLARWEKWASWAL